MALAKKNEATPEVTETETPAAVEEVVETESVLEEDTPPEAATVETQAITTAKADQPPAVTSQQEGVLGHLQSKGFGGLTLDWTSFPTIVLDNGEFCTADGNPLDTKEITVRLSQSRKRYVLRTDVSNDEDAELAYTYDMAELDDPESDLAVKVRTWREEDNVGFKVKEYIEALAIVQDEELELHQNMVLLQVPPTSCGRFSGYLTELELIHKIDPTQCLTTCYAGKKITKAVKPFVPWSFKKAD
jgi:hypothetical protein